MKKFMVTIVALLVIIAAICGGILTSIITGVDVNVHTRTPKVTVEYVESDLAF